MGQCPRDWWLELGTPAWAPILGEGTELPGQAFELIQLWLPCTLEPALSPLSGQNRLNQFGRLQGGQGLVNSWKHF